MPPDVGTEFSSAGAGLPDDVASNPQYVTAGEQQVFEILLQIAQIYCTPAGDKIPTCPKMYPSLEERWGPYHIAFMDYAVDDEPSCEGDTPDETVTRFNPAVHNGIQQMLGDISLYGVGDFHTQSFDEVEMLTFRTIQDMITTANSLLECEDFPGSPYTRDRLKNLVMQAVRTIDREQAGAGPGAGCFWH